MATVAVACTAPIRKVETPQLLDDHVSRHLLESDGKIGALHLTRQSAGEALARAFVTQDADGVPGFISGQEEGKALDMIPMRVGDEEGDVHRGAVELAGQLEAQRPDARPGVQDDDLIVRAHFDAGGVASILHRGGSGSWNGPADSPEGNLASGRRSRHLQAGIDPLAQELQAGQKIPLSQFPRSREDGPIVMREASLEKQSGEGDAAARELERRVEQLTAELEKANRYLQHEIAERARIEAELCIKKERLDLAGITDGLWDWDLATGRICFSPRWKEMLGCEHDEIGDTFKEWETRLHPDDRNRALATIHDYLTGKSVAFALEHRLRHKDGSYRWILSRGVAVRDGLGKPLRMAGSSVDLTERRHAEQALMESESKLRALITNVPAILFSIDRNGVIAMAEGLGMEVLKFIKGGSSGVPWRNCMGTCRGWSKA